MARKKQYKRSDRERQIRDNEIRPMLKGLGWLVEVTHGNKFSSGLPDLFLAHPQHGLRWVDVKVEGKYSYTKAQIAKWPVWHLHGAGVWIMTGATEDQYQRLWKPPNWQDYWKASYGDPFKPTNMDELLDTITDVE